MSDMTWRERLQLLAAAPILVPYLFITALVDELRWRLQGWW